KWFDSKVFEAPLGFSRGGADARLAGLLRRPTEASSEDDAGRSGCRADRRSGRRRRGRRRRGLAGYRAARVAAVLPCRTSDQRAVGAKRARYFGAEQPLWARGDIPEPRRRNHGFLEQRAVARRQPTLVGRFPNGRRKAGGSGDGVDERAVQ